MRRTFSQIIVKQLPPEARIYAIVVKSKYAKGWWLYWRNATHTKLRTAQTEARKVEKILRRANKEAWRFRCVRVIRVI